MIMKLVEKILAVLKLDENGKISKFFESLKKEMKREIAKLEANKKAEALQYEQDKDALLEQIEDAKEALEHTYENVTLEDIKTNEAINSFKDVYLGRIYKAEMAVKRLENELAYLEKEYTTSVEEIDEQIAKYKAMIAKFE